MFSVHRDLSVEWLAFPPCRQTHPTYRSECFSIAHFQLEDPAPLESGLGLNTGLERLNFCGQQLLAAEIQTSGLRQPIIVSTNEKT